MWKRLMFYQKMRLQWCTDRSHPFFFCLQIFQGWTAGCGRSCLLTSKGFPYQICSYMLGFNESFSLMCAVWSWTIKKTTNMTVVKLISKYFMILKEEFIYQSRADNRMFLDLRCMHLWPVLWQETSCACITYRLLINNRLTLICAALCGLTGAVFMICTLLGPHLENRTLQTAPFLICSLMLIGPA